MEQQEGQSSKCTVMMKCPAVRILYVTVRSVGRKTTYAILNAPHVLVLAASSLAFAQVMALEEKSEDEPSYWNSSCEQHECL